MRQIVDGIAIDVKQPQWLPRFRRFGGKSSEAFCRDRHDLRPQEVELKRLLDQKDSEQR